MRLNMTMMFALASTLGLAGCGGASPSREADPTLAREALASTLRAWKDGGRPDVLASQSPPIRVADEDWLAGLRLDDFQVGPPDRMVGSSLNCPVTLKLKDAKGRPVRKKVVYRVGTDPSLMVVRQD